MERRIPRTAFASFLAELRQRDGKTAEREEGDNVGDDHEVIEEVGKSPDKGVLEDGACEDAQERNDGIDDGGFLAEEIGEVDSAEEVPADDGGEGEEEEASRNEDTADGVTDRRIAAEERGEAHLEGALYHIGVNDTDGGGEIRKALAFGSDKTCERSLGCIKRGKNDECGDGKNDEGVDEYADHCADALIVRLFDVSLRVRVGGGTHARFVGEETSLCALLDCLGKCCAEAAAEQRLGNEGVTEDHAECGGNIFIVDSKNEQTADDIHDGHDRNDLFRDGRDSLDTAEEDEGGKNGDQNADDPSPCGNIHVEGFKNADDARRDGVGLYRRTDEAAGNGQCHGEEACEKFAELTLEGVLDVIDGTAADLAVFMNDARFLCEDCFDVVGCHAEEGDDPHPEDGTRTADENCAADAYDITRADLRRNGGRQCLERGKTGIALVLLGKYRAESRAEAADLNEFRSDGKIKTCRNEQEYQYVARHIVIDVIDDFF